MARPMYAAFSTRPDIWKSKTRRMDKPNISEGNVVMVLAGLRSAGTEAAAEYVTSKTFLNELNERLGQMADSSGPPKYYQALLKVGVENAIPTTISLLTIHELSGQKR